MKPIAVICFAHLGNPAGVRRLAAYFARAGAHLYVHVDAKAPIEPYAHALAGLPGVTLLAERTAIYWCGFTLALASVVSLQRIRAERLFHRYCLISEDTAPLVPPSLFARLMSDEREYMPSGRFTEGPMFARYTGFFYLDSVATNPRGDRDARVVDPGVIHALTRLEALRTRGKFPLRELWHGSNWFALSDRATTIILAAWNEQTHLRESFEFSLLPEEQYFHTILARSGVHFDLVRYMHVDFSRDPSPYVYQTAKELNGLRSMPFIFARKVPVQSAEIDAYVQQL